MIKTITKILLCCSLIILSSSCLAFSWQDLWLRPDEQGSALLKRGNAAEAAEKFQDRAWQGVAYYRAGKYSDAAQAFSGIESSLGHYNRGNSLAHLGQYPQAIDAYENALRYDPSNERAKEAKAIVEKLLQQAQHEPRKNRTNQPDPQQAAAQESGQGSDKKNAANSQQGKQPNNPQQATKQAGQEQKKMVLSEQQKQQHEAAKQWLKRIQDEPGGLLRQKFLRDHIRRHQQEVAYE